MCLSHLWNLWMCHRLPSGVWLIYDRWHTDVWIVAKITHRCVNSRTDCVQLCELCDITYACAWGMCELWHVWVFWHSLQTDVKVSVLSICTVWFCVIVLIRTSHSFCLMYDWPAPPAVYSRFALYDFVIVLIRTLHSFYLMYDRLAPLAVYPRPIITCIVCCIAVYSKESDCITPGQDQVEVWILKRWESTLKMHHKTPLFFKFIYCFLKYLNPEIWL